MSSDYDVVVVGARCAGAAVAALLARRGARVLLLDKDPLPSDHVISTHFISAPGVDVLDDLGVGDAMRAVSPAGHVIRLNADGAVTDLRLPRGRAAYCPRRERLDGLLQQAAATAGATLIARTRVTDVIRERDRVAGVRTAGDAGERRITADLVVGADGRHSTIARLVNAEEYLGYDARRAAYWAYWDAPAGWKTDTARGFDMYFGYFGTETGVIFPTDHDQLVIGSWPAAARVGLWRENVEETLRRVLAAEPTIGPIIGGRPPASPVRGAIKERFYFRRAAGDGWVLVGDAGHHKDFVIGDGMTEALRQARDLSAAIARGSDKALTRWWRARDVEALPIYFIGKEAGARDPLPELQRAVLSRVNTDPALMDVMLDLIDRRVSPFDARLGLRVGWSALAASIGSAQRMRQLLRTGLRATPLYLEWLRRKALRSLRV